MNTVILSTEATRSLGMLFAGLGAGLFLGVGLGITVKVSIEAGLPYFATGLCVIGFTLLLRATMPV